MAMTKKEAAEVEKMKQELRLRGALRATSNVEPDVPIPSGSYSDRQGLSKGFMFVSESGYWPRVEPSCSSSVYHSIGRDDRTTTQEPMRLYSTRLLALRALRYAIEQDCCARLTKVDKMIEEETNKASS